MASSSLLDNLINVFIACKEPKHNEIQIDMNVFEYSTLLYNAFVQNNYPYGPDDKLMNLCVDISLWITSPNQSIHQYEFAKYFNTLNTYFYENISHVIIAFIFDPSKYLKWIQFQNIPLKLIKNMDIDEFIEFMIKEIYIEIGDTFDSVALTELLLSNDITVDKFNTFHNAEQFCDECGLSHIIASDVLTGVFFQIKTKIVMEIEREKKEQSQYAKWQNQLTYSENDSIVDFSHARYDIINIRTDLLSNDTKYFINIYCFEKCDELWLGLVNKSAYEPSRYYRVFKYGLFYYGGRQRKIKRHGGLITDPCSATHSSMASDCNHGSIQGSNKVIKHPLAPYACGDWIHFVIDMKNKKIAFYKNGMKQYELENANYFPDGDCYFIVEVDGKGDKFYIEQAINDSALK